MRTSTARPAIVAISITVALATPAFGGAILNPTGSAHASARASAGVTPLARPTTLGPASTGQPNQTCGSATAPLTPGNAATAPGSAFNPDGRAGAVYAGEQPQNSINTASVSQYDVACAHQR